MSDRRQPSPTDSWQRHLRALQAWIASGFRDDAAAQELTDALDQWLGAYPDQATDVGKLALGCASLAASVDAHEHAAACAAVVIEASTFRPLGSLDDVATAAFGALLYAAARLESATPSEGGQQLHSARALVARMDVSSALRAWAAAQADLIDGAYAERVLERSRAQAHYEDARNGLEPLVRNARLRKELIAGWLRLAFGDAHSATDHEEMAVQLVQGLVQSQLVRAALGSARTAESDSAAAASIAAALCAEFGVPQEVTAVDLHAAFHRLADEDRASALDRIVARHPDPHAKDQSIRSVLYALRARSTAGDAKLQDFDRALKAAASAHDACAWTALTSELIARGPRSAREHERRDFDAFLMAYDQVASNLCGTSREFAFRAHFEPTVQRIAAAALREYLAEPNDSTSAHLSACLEAGRSSSVAFRRPLPESADMMRARAQGEAMDWLGRIAHAVKRHPDAMVVVPVVTPEGTTLLCVTDAGVEAHAAGDRFASSTRELSAAMQRSFEKKRDAAELVAAGRDAHAALPSRAKAHLRIKHTVLIVPDAAAERSAVPYELFHGSKGFLGVTHAIARVPTLRDVARILEPPIIPIASSKRALTCAAPDTIPDHPLRFAQKEIEGVRARLAGAKWDVPRVDGEAVAPTVVLDALRLGSLVHIAAHGEAFGGAHAILLPGGARLTTDSLAAQRGHFEAAVYLSACSIGASEYLGGGVMRGFAAALIAKGAPAVIASQWPLHDAAAERFAEALYEHALDEPLGEALRAARARVAADVPPAFCGSLILIGDPWHRLGADVGMTGDDSTTLFSAMSFESFKDERARERALRASDVAAKADPSDRRLAAANAWARELDAWLSGAHSTDAIESIGELASLARDLGNPRGEAFCRTIAWELLTGANREDAAREALDKAIDVCETIARGDESWSSLLIGLLAQRERMDVRVEPETLELASGLKINDRSDPAVRAILEVQQAVDRQSTRREGEVGTRWLERSLDDACWNGVVAGRRTRFSDDLACAAFARGWTARAVASGWIEGAIEFDAKCVATGMLQFLWSTQRMTHLERERARHQASALAIALRSLSDDAALREDNRCPERARVREARERLLAESQSPVEGRFARTRAQLRGEGSQTAVAALATRVDEYLTDVPAGDMVLAHRMAWSLGLLLDVAYELRRANRETQAEHMLAEHYRHGLDARTPLEAYLYRGAERLGDLSSNPLLGWSVRARAKVPDARRKKAKSESTRRARAPNRKRASRRED